MSFERLHRESILSPEQEARGKIRDWLSDPKLKFHFSRPRDMKRILGQGILSHAFADYIGDPIRENYTLSAEELSQEEREKISIADREKNPLSQEQDAELRKDWWLKIMEREDGYVGYLLPSELRMLPGSPHVHESHASVRIRPQLIEGLFIFDDPSLAEPVLMKTYHFGSPAVEYLQEFFSILPNALIASHPELQKLDEERRTLLKQGKQDSLEIHTLLTQIDRLLEQEAIKMIQRFIPKPKQEITRLDFYLHFAKQFRLPLYVLQHSLKKATVVWPQGDVS